MTQFSIDLFDYFFARCMRDMTLFTSSPLHEGNQLLWAKSGLPSTWYNCICNLASNKENGQDLTQLIGKFIESKTQFYLYNGIYEEGKESTKTILAAGAEAIGSMDGMVFDLEKPLSTLKNNHALRIQVVDTKDDFIVYAETQALAGELDKNVGTQYFNNFEGLKAAPFKLLIAYVNNTPAGCSFLYIPKGEVALNNWDWVRPEFKKQGINSAMVVERLRLAKAAGFKFVIAQCIDTSTRLYANLGFEKTCEFDVYDKYMC